MSYSTFNRKHFDSNKRTYVFVANVNVCSLWSAKHRLFFLKLNHEKQRLLFLAPWEVDLSTDRKDFQRLEEHRTQNFFSNLKYQNFAGHGTRPFTNVAFYCPMRISAELETWIEHGRLWTIHSRSLHSIIRNIVNDRQIFDDIVTMKKLPNVLIVF